MSTARDFPQPVDNTAQQSTFGDYLAKESSIIADESLHAEQEDILYPLPVGQLRHETQSKGQDTCFIHATNMYFQREYSNSTMLAKYAALVSKAANEIDALKSANCATSFYGEEKPPAPGAVFKSEHSQPLANEDLNGYYELYASTPASSFLQDITDSNLKELSPPHCLFLLEFQMFPANQGEEQLHYVPHRFYHRYARSKVEGDIAASKEAFIHALNGAHKDTQRAFFAHIESGKSHAFAAVKTRLEDEDYWVLMDSLLNTPRLARSADQLIQKHCYAGRASVMVVPDTSRETVRLA